MGALSGFAPSLGAAADVVTGHAEIGEGVVVGPGSSIHAARLTLGPHTRIGANCRLVGRDIHIGDRVTIADNSNIEVTTFVVGDYVKLHNHLLALGDEPMVIGHNGWFGQNLVINSSGAGLTIGNNVSIGAYSSVYSHAWHGELLEGCTIASSAPVTIEDDAWILGAYNVISPGVTIGRRALVLTGSVVTCDVPADTTFAGAPARDCSDRIRAYEHVSDDERLRRMAEYVLEYARSLYAERHEVIEDGVRCHPPEGEPFDVLVGRRRRDLSQAAAVVYVLENDGGDAHLEATVFDLRTKTYVKRRTPVEVQIIGFMNRHLARFVPADRAVVRVDDVRHA